MAKKLGNVVDQHDNLLALMAVRQRLAEFTEHARFVGQHWKQVEQAVKQEEERNG